MDGIELRKQEFLERFDSNIKNLVQYLRTNDWTRASEKLRIMSMLATEIATGTNIPKTDLVKIDQK